MKKTIILIALLLALPWQIFAQADKFDELWATEDCADADGLWDPTDMEDADGLWEVAVSSGTCQAAIVSSSWSGPVSVGRYSGHNYKGALYTPSTYTTICTIKWNPNATTNPSTLDYYWEVWSLDGSNNFDTLQGRSDKIDGDNAWNYSQQTATISVSGLTVSETYAVVVKAIASDADPSTAGQTNSSVYIDVRFCNECDGVSDLDGMAYWDSSGENMVNDAEDDMEMEIHAIY